MDHTVFQKTELPVLLPYDVSLYGKGNALEIMMTGEKLSAKKQIRSLFVKQTL